MVYIKNYLISIPSPDQFKLFDGSEFVLGDGKSIKWYVIKKEGDGWHVDGIIVENKTTTEEKITTEEETTTAGESATEETTTEEEATTAGETTTEPETPEEEDIDFEVAFAAAKTGDTSKFALYLTLLIGAAVGGMVVATSKKKEEN